MTDTKDPNTSLPASPTPQAGGESRDARQRVVVEWGSRCFGADHMLDVKVRAARFLEEAAELAQAVGLPKDHAQRALDHVYSRPAGDPKQEAGGAGLTLLALCDAIGLSADGAEQTEVARCLSKPPEHFAARNKNKIEVVDTPQASAVNAQDPELLLESLLHFGKSQDGSVERDLRNAIRRLKDRNGELELIQINRKLRGEPQAGGDVVVEALRDLKLQCETIADKSWDYGDTPGEAARECVAAINDAIIAAALSLPTAPVGVEEAEKTGLTHTDIRGLIKRHGGAFHGPNVEHLNMEERAFWRFIEELILNERRAVLSLLTGER